MALGTVFATLPGSPPNVGGSQLDSNFNAVGAMAVMQCVASGTNAITLTPVANQVPVNAYTDLQLFSFRAVSNSTGAVTAAVVAANGTTLGFVSVYHPGSPQQQAGVGGRLSIINALDYLVMYDASLPGFVIVSAQFAPNHPSIAKAWVNFSATGGVVTVNANYNVASVVRNGTGDYTVTFTSAFANANYAASLSGIRTQGAGNLGFIGGSAVSVATTTTFRIQTANSSGTLADWDNVYAVFFGTQ